MKDSSRRHIQGERNKGADTGQRGADSSKGEEDHHKALLP